MHCRSVVLLSLLPFAACRPSPRLPASPDALLAADRAFDSTVAARRLEGWVEFFADSGRQIDGRGGFVVGHEAIRAHMGRFFGDTTVQLRWQPDHARVSEDGTLGYTMGLGQISRRRGDSTVIVERSRYLTVWRRQVDGSWQVDADIGTSVEP
jgi:ketosteroid isomerase-like protein